MSKYGNRKVAIGGRVYDSVKEAQRAQQLQLMQKAGLISDLKEQVRYVLIPSQKIDGKVVERAVSYIADFVYLDNKTGKVVVEDVKGYRKGNAYAIFSIKRKLMLQVFGLRVKEI